MLSDRQSFYLDNEGEQRRRASVAEEFLLQYYASAMSIPPLIVVQRELAEGSELEVLAELLAERRGGAGRDPRRRARRQAPHPRARRAQRAARARPGEAARPSAAASSASRRSTALQAALGLDALPVRIECFDISNLGGTHTVASMVVFEGGAPKKSDYRRFTIRDRRTAATISPRWTRCCRRRYAQWEKQHERSPYDADRDASFAALPEPGRDRRRPGPARRPACEPLQGFRERGVAVVSLAKRIEEVFLPGAPRAAACSPHDTPELQLLQRVRDEAHRFAITHHRIRRDKAMTESIMDDLPGHRPGAQARAAQALRLARGGARRHARGARGGARRAREGRRASSTPTSTGPVDRR